MRTLLLMGLIVSSALAQAPNSVSGRIFEETRYNVDSYGYNATVAALRIDGTYATIVREHSLVPKAAGEPGIRTIRPTDQGTYVFEKTGPNSATLVLSSATGLGVVTKPLVFYSESRGMVLGPPLDVIHFNLSSIADAPIVNASARGSASTSKPLIVGFYISGRPRYVLVRAIGPTLAHFGVPDAAQDTRLEIVSSSKPSPPDVIVLGPWNDDWGTDTDYFRNLAPGASSPAATIGAFMGAFPLPVGSKDAAIALRFQPGAYTAVIRTKSETPAEVLAEIYVVP